MNKIMKKIGEKVRGWMGQDVEVTVQEVPVGQSGDLGLVVFGIAKVVGKNPVEVAQSLVDEIEWGEDFEKVEVVGSYVNFTLSEGVWCELVQGVGGVKKMGKKEKIVVDYGGENVAKPQSVGHLRSSILGQAYVNCARELGYSVIGDNHLGDWGSQFGRLMWALGLMDKLDKGDMDFENIENKDILSRWNKIKKEKISEVRGRLKSEYQDESGEPTEEFKRILNNVLVEELLKAYVDMHKKIQDDEHKEFHLKGARRKFKELSEGDEYLTEVWEDMVEITIENLKQVYVRLGVEFDYFLGESFYRGERMEGVVEACEKLEHLEKNADGSWAVVPPEETKLPSFLIRKADGATLYHTSDLAAIWYRINEWGAGRVVYFVAEPQSLHFRQLFWLVGELGWGVNTKFEHASFGLVRLPEGKMSTRKGNIVRLEELLDEAVRRARAELEKRGVTDEGGLAEAIGVGAVIYEDLYKDRTKHVVFDWNEALSFEGQSGPYVQYAHARACAILRKAEEVGVRGEKMEKVSEAREKELIKKMVQLEEVLERTVREAKPSYLAQWVYELASEFNAFYANVPVLGVEDEVVRKSRVVLVGAVRKCLAKGLGLLGLKAVERM